MLRRIALCSLLTVAVAACDNDKVTTLPPNTSVTSVFDPVAPLIPLPSELVFLQDLNSLGLPAAEVELLNAFKAQGGYPNDQAVPVTFEFQKRTTNSDGSVTRIAPALDLETLDSSTVIVYTTGPSGSGMVAIDPVSADDYVDNGEYGTLSLHRAGRIPWAPGKYYVMVRGGTYGLKTDDGTPVTAAPILDLMVHGADLNSRESIAIIAEVTGSTATAESLAPQLQIVNTAIYPPAYAVADTVFPHQEIAVLTTFEIAPLVTQVALDPGRGLVPLPIDLLREPGPGGKLTPLAACTLAAGELNPLGQCVNSQGALNQAAAGFAQLDGFSTTAALLAPTSELVQAATVTGGIGPDGTTPVTPTIYLFDLTDPANPVVVDPKTYIAEPCEFTSACGPAGQPSTAYSPVIAIQPAGATSNDPSSVFRTRPLKDATDYAVVMTTGVLDKSNRPIAPGTVGKILLFDNPLVVNGQSQLTEIDDATATQLDVMRLQLQPVTAKLATLGVTKSQIGMAYTFRTQTILSTASQLALLPYTQPAATQQTGPITVLTPAEAFDKYGVDASRVPSSHVREFLETTITTFNLLDPLTGAFRSDPSQAQAETIPVLVAVPNVASGPTGSQLVIYRHGLGRGRLDMLAIADALTERGFVVAAIDAAKHGDRTLCNRGATTVGGIPICKDGAACVSPLPNGAQGDSAPPGTCVAGYTTHAVMSACDVTGCGMQGPPTGGIPLLSSNFLLTSNFFRTRDSLRQDVIDQSQLIRAIAIAPPSPLAPVGHTVFDRLLTNGVVVNPLSIAYVGQSLGSIQGTLNVATNPRISTAVLNVGGGTLVDILLNSPSFAAQSAALLAGLGVSKGSSQYLQLVSVAKTVLDPADPVNFAGHLTTNTLPNLLANPDGTVAQTPKSVLTQIAYCDQTVPNPFGYIWASTIGTGPQPGAPTFGAAGTSQLYYHATGPIDLTSCPAPGGSPIPSSAVEHGFLISFANLDITGRAQTDAASFVETRANVLSFVALP